MRVLVTGGRDFNDQALVVSTLDGLHAKTPITSLIHGGAQGADRLADAWATERGSTVEQFKPNWKLHGRGAGLANNKAMLEAAPDVLIAFPGGKGTADMVHKAQAAGLPVIQAKQT